jgi:hypothetical protein
VSGCLRELEREKVKLLERLAEIGARQKAVQREVRRVERSQRAALREVEEPWVPDDQELTLSDVEAWLRSCFSIMAHSAPANPHVYWNRRRCEYPRMFERVVAYVLANGYEQAYGKEAYVCLDVELHGSRWFIWPMVREASESVVLNAKPSALRPDPEPQPRLGDAL